MNPLTQTELKEWSNMNTITSNIDILIKNRRKNKMKKMTSVQKMKAMQKELLSINPDSITKNNAMDVSIKINECIKFIPDVDMKNAKNFCGKETVVYLNGIDYRGGYEAPQKFVYLIKFGYPHNPQMVACVDKKEFSKWEKIAHLACVCGLFRDSKKCYVIEKMKYNQRIELIEYKKFTPKNLKEGVGVLMATNEYENQGELAKIIGVHQPQLSWWCNGKFKPRKDNTSFLKLANMIENESGVRLVFA